MKENQDNFNLLRKIQNRPESTQRELAKDLGFSLGKLNYCLKELNKKGLIKIKNFKNKKKKIIYFKKYVLTPKGINLRINLTIQFMKKKIKEYDELKSEINKQKFMWIVIKYKAKEQNYLLKELKDALLNTENSNGNDLVNIT